MKDMIEYGYLDGDRQDPSWYENQHPMQHDTSTATVWALHLNVAAMPDPNPVILERLSQLPEVTGEYTFGDSWEEWGEDLPEGAPDCHMVIYFRSHPSHAALTGQGIVSQVAAATLPEVSDAYANYAISTAGDYAEIIR